MVKVYSRSAKRKHCAEAEESWKKSREGRYSGELAKTSASGKSRLEQCMLPVGTVPPKVWRESESSSLDIAPYSGRLEHPQCRWAGVWQNPVGGFPTRPARSGCEYRDPGAARRRHNP